MHIKYRQLFRRHLASLLTQVPKMDRKPFREHPSGETPSPYDHLPDPGGLDAPGDLHRARKDLQERTKKLHCLFMASEMIFDQNRSLDQILEHVVNIIPRSFQFPEITCARIILDGKVFQSPGCGNQVWILDCPIHRKGQKVGQIIACYTRQPPTGPQDPFLEEEWTLLTTISRNISLVLEMYNLRKTLRETQGALKTVLSTIKDEKDNTTQAISRNVQTVLLPLIQDLLNVIPEDCLRYVTLLQSGLMDVASPFVDSLSERYSRLTHSEIQICSLIRSGMRSKDIARMKGISPTTVFRHREHIRRKLGLTNRSLNLSTFLRSHF